EIDILKKENESLKDEVEKIRQALGITTTRTSTARSSENEFTIIPNPARDQVSIHVNNPSGMMKLTCSDASGKKVMSRKLYEMNATIDTSQLSAGTYMVTLTKEDGTQSTMRLLVQK